MFNYIHQNQQKKLLENIFILGQKSYKANFSIEQYIQVMILEFNPTKLGEVSFTHHKESSQTKNSSFYRNFKLKLKEKVHKSSSNRHQRNLSPWTRKKDEQAHQKNQPHEQPVPQIMNLIEKTNEMSNKNTSVVFDETKMSDFLQKIQFTKRKQNLPQGKFPIHKFAKPIQKEVFDPINFGKETSNNAMDLSEAEIKKLIIYPRVQKKTEQNGKKEHQSKIKAKKKQLSVKKMASIQNFYDPYQNTSKISNKLHVERGIAKFRLRIDDELSLTKTESFDDSAVFDRPSQMLRKKSVPDNLHRRNYSMPENKSASKQTTGGDKQQICRSTFFKTKKSSKSHICVTEPTERERFVNENNKLNANPEEGQQINFEPTYVTPSCQVIRRIKLKQKKSHRMKTQTSHSNSKQLNNSSSIQRKEENNYLYQTFLNYKSQKDSNDVNITKTLGFNFHNIQSFQHKMQSTWLKPKSG